MNQLNVPLVVGHYRCFGSGTIYPVYGWKIGNLCTFVYMYTCQTVSNRCLMFDNVLTLAL